MKLILTCISNYLILLPYSTTSTQQKSQCLGLHCSYLVAFALVWAGLLRRCGDTSARYRDAEILPGRAVWFLTGESLPGVSWEVCLLGQVLGSRLPLDECCQLPKKAHRKSILMKG